MSKCIKNMLKANRNLFSFSYLSELSKCEKDSNIEREKEREKEKKGREAQSEREINRAARMRGKIKPKLLKLLTESKTYLGQAKFAADSTI